MNLRQKVKQAVKELVVIEEKYRGTSTWDIVQKFQAKNRLQKIIDYKRKPDRFYHWNEECQIDWNKLSHISLHADFNELLTMTSTNGKPLSKRQLGEFLDECRMKIYEFGIKVQQREPDGKRKYVDYLFFVSNDRKKGKRIHPHKFYYQYVGDDKLYPYDESK